MRNLLRNTAFLILLARSGACVPVVLLDNLAGIAVGASSVSGPGSVPGPFVEAMPFVNGASAATLTQAELGFGFLNGGADANGSFLSVSLYSDLAGSPGALLQALTSAPGAIGANGGTSVTTFTPTAAFVLAANTNYWILAEATNSAWYGWNASFTGPTGRTAPTSAGPFTPAGSSLATRVTADTLAAVGTPELDQSAGAMPLLWVAGLLVLSHRRKLTSYSVG